MAKVKGITLVGNTALKALLRLLRGVKEAFDFGSIAAHSANVAFLDTTLTVTGAQLGDHVQVAPKASLPAGVILYGFVNAVDTVTIRACNLDGAARDPAVQDFVVTVNRHTDI